MALLPNNLSRIIKGSGISHKENSISFVFTCPKCNKKDRLYIRKRDGIFRCFYCITTVNFQGKAEYALQHLLERSYKDIQKDIYDNIEQKIELFINLSIVDFDDEIETTVELDPLPILTFPLDFYTLTHDFSKKGREYLLKRNLDIDMCQEYDIRYCPSERRIVFPVKHEGNIYGWQNRTILENPSVPKMLSSTNLPKNRTLMFMDRLKGLGYAILTEGPIDALKCHLIGGGNVATMGKQVSDGQIQLLLDHGIKKLYLALDPDAYMEMDLLCNKWRHIFELFLMHPHKKDIGEMDYEEVLELFKHAPKIEPHYIFSYIKGSDNV